MLSPILNSEIRGARKAIIKTPTSIETIGMMMRKRFESRMLSLISPEPTDFPTITQHALQMPRKKQKEKI
jgi:hypothetical protein